MSLVGFSDGTLNKLFSNEADRYKNIYLQDYFFDAIEIHCSSEKTMDFIINDLDVNLYSKFRYISMHAPSFYSENKDNIRLLQRLREIHKKFNLVNIVVHPDQINDWHILGNFRDLPLSVENMDSDKDSFKTAIDFEDLIYQMDVNITLDLNHIYDNDQGMFLAKEFHEKFSDKIVEYHLSGYDPIKKHVSLAKSKQMEIINALSFKEVPIIIESELDSIDSMVQEYDFIVKNLGRNT
ncbi:MAG: hypothetical protein ACQESA_03230 [Patescibacteria group bacterium]